MEVGAGTHGSVVGPHELGEVVHSSAALVLDDSFGCVLKTHQRPVAEVRKALDLLRASRADRVRQVDENRQVANCYRASRATEVVACAFRNDHEDARDALRRAWFQTLDGRDEVAQWADRNIGEPIVAVWLRVSGNEPSRNMSREVAEQLVGALRAAGFRTCLFGDDLPGTNADVDLHGLWRRDVFNVDTSFRRQLYLFDHLVRNGRIRGAVGAKSGSMDGPALLGVKTIYLEQAEDPKAWRMEQWTNGVVPGYTRVQCAAFLRDAAGRLREGELGQVVGLLR